MITAEPTDSIPPFDAAAGLLAFLDRTERLPDVVARRRRSIERLDLRPGAAVLDAGCGAGTAAREMARLVAPGGVVHGVDVNQDLLDTAARRAEADGVSCSFQHADATRLPFETGSLAGYHAERLVQHLPDPAAALAEAHRVLSPGGRIVIVDQDWDGVLIDSNDIATARAIVRSMAGGIRNPHIARGYRRLLLDAGFHDVDVVADAHVSTSYHEYGFVPEMGAMGAEASGAIPSMAVQSWLSDLRERGKQGRFLLVMVYFVASARR